MIPKGLKVGDTFDQSGALFKVLEVLGDRYSVIRVGDSSPVDAVKPKKDVEEVKEDYSSMPYAQLKKVCAEKGLDATGTKADLLARLEG